MSRRWPLTLFVTLALLGVYRVYAQILGPMTRPRVAQVVLPAARIEGGGHASHSAREAARLHLVDQPWAQQARYTWEKLGERYVFFNEGGPVPSDGRTETKNQWKFRPFAMIVRNPKTPDEPPTVLTAEEARITFKDKIDQFTSSNSGDNRMVGAELDGAVSLTGPNGLSMRGSRFVFSETTRSLYSDDPLTFTYGPTAESNTRFVCDAEDIAVTLQAGDNELLGKDLPRITDFEHLTLRRKVRFHIEYDRKGTLSPVDVTSDGSFEFDRQERKASFERNVALVQRTSAGGKPPEYNRLNCQRLEMRFDEPAAEAVTADVAARKSKKQDLWDQKSRSLAGLSLHYVSAGPPLRRGEEMERVEFISDENALTAKMEQFTFDATQGTLSLTDPEQCTIVRQNPKDGTSTTLLTRRLFAGLAEAQPPAKPVNKKSFQPMQQRFGEIESVMCSGQGKLIHRDDKGQIVLTATWKDKLRLDPDEQASDPATTDRILELSGQTKILPGIDYSLDADTVTLTIPAAAFDREEERPDARRPKVLPVRRAHATGHVTLSGPEANARTNDLDVSLSPGVLPELTRQSKTPAQATDQAKAAAKLPPPWDGQADRIEVDAIIDPNASSPDSGRTKVDFRKITVVGLIDFKRPELVRGARDPNDGEMKISGHKLTVTNAGGNDQTAVLVSRVQPGRTFEPARFSAGDASIEGQQITVNRATSHLTVAGSTTVCWPLEKDGMGRKVGVPTLVTIRSVDGMNFDGLTARFLRDVKVLMSQQAESRVDSVDSSMKCEELVAELDRPWSLTGSTSNSRPEFRVIRSPSQVTIETYEFEKNALSRVFNAVFGKFEMYPQKTDGRFTGAGPGRIDQWQRGSLHLNLTADASASANRPTSSTELPWSYTQLTFEGTVKGSLVQRIAVFNDRVKAIYAPVAQAKQPFERQDLSSNSESARRAVWMGCDGLEVSLSEPRPQYPRGSITLVAQGKAELEGRTVHATAHQISFDQEKDLFTLRGRGSELANVYFDPEPGTTGQRGQLPGGTIEINGRTRATRIVDAGTVTGAN